MLPKGQLSLEVSTDSEHRTVKKGLDHFVNLSLDMFCIVGLEGCLRYFNPVCTKTFGYTKDESLSLFLRDLVHPEDRERFTVASKQVRDGIRVEHFENRFRCKDGSYKWVVWNAAFVTAEGLTYVVARDISQRIRMESEMLRLNRLNLVGEMAAGIAHEIRNPMASARGFIQLLGEKPECKSYHQYFNLIADELDRANTIISEFLTVVKNRPIDRRLHNLNCIVGALLPLIEADALRADKNVKCELGEVPDLLLDEKEIRQLILNLTRNGLEAMTGKGVLTISTFQRADETVLAIADQGSGISPAILDKLGTPFLTTKKQGTGLGLASCFSIAQRHNATITVDMGLKRTTFLVRFRLPGVS